MPAGGNSSIFAGLLALAVSAATAIFLLRSRRRSKYAALHDKSYYEKRDGGNRGLPEGYAHEESPRVSQGGPTVDTGSAEPVAAEADVRSADVPELVIYCDSPTPGPQAPSPAAASAADALAGSGNSVHGGSPQDDMGIGQEQSALPSPSHLSIDGFSAGSDVEEADDASVRAVFASIQVPAVNVDGGVEETKQNKYPAIPVQVTSAGDVAAGREIPSADRDLGEVPLPAAASRGSRSVSFAPLTPDAGSGPTAGAARVLSKADDPSVVDEAKKLPAPSKPSFDDADFEPKEQADQLETELEAQGAHKHQPEEEVKYEQQQQIEEEQEEKLPELLTTSPPCWQNPQVLGFNKLRARTTVGAFSSVEQARCEV